MIENDYRARFADLTGDGKADYLCIAETGLVRGYLNRGMTSQGQITFEDVGQIKLTTNYDRQNTRFNDVNGEEYLPHPIRSSTDEGIRRWKS